MAANLPAPARPPSFGEFVFRARAKRSLSQTEVATRAGISKSYLSGLENSRLRPPATDTVVRLADALSLREDARVQLQQLAAHGRRAPVVIPPTVPAHVFELASRLQQQADVLDEETARELQSALLKET